MPLSSLALDFDQLPVPAWVFELDGTIARLNEAAALLHGHAAADIVGKKAWEFAPGGEHVWPELVRNARARGQYRADITLATPHGPRSIHYLAVLRTEGERTFFLVLGVERDPSVEAARAAEVHAKQRVEALGLVAGGIAHDFNNQLTSVLVEASAARESGQLSEATAESLTRIEAAANRMAQLTRQLLAYAGRGRFVSELLDPDQLVRDARDQLAQLAKPVDLAITTGAGRVVIEADRALLVQVLANLVANAAEAQSQAPIEITTSAASGRWQIEIRDRGTGMDPDTVARIWDPFFTTKRGHDGLGLSAVVGIVRRLSGEITVESRPANGSLFTLRFPLAAGEVKPRRAPKQTAHGISLAGMRALIADDEPAVRTTIRRLLERRNATVVTAASGTEAEARLREGTYAFIVLDVMMPGLTGYQLLPIARETNPDARVLLMSGYTEVERSVGGDDGPDAFLEKPFTSKSFSDAIDELLS
ncbi:MAG TPA: ATP-binding protein [Kofleriaceae bacterium]|nr:ATP-binding protein [Kofleriaceae bacterium]